MDTQVGVVLGPEIPIPRAQPKVHVRVDTHTDMLGRLAEHFTKIWWRFDALLERWRNSMAQEASSYDPRIPPDVPIQIAVSGRGRQPEGRDGRIDTLLQGLILAAILGLVGIIWNLRDNVTEIKTLVTTKVQQYDRDFARIDATLERHDQRIADLERGEGPRQPYPYDRQKR